MTREKQVAGWKVRVVLPGTALHFVSATEPRLHVNKLTGRPVGIDWEPTDEGDTPSYIDWSAVIAVTYRDGRAQP